jgi:hypothetical protein
MGCYSYTRSKSLVRWRSSSTCGCNRSIVLSTSSSVYSTTSHCCALLVHLIHGIGTNPKWKRDAVNSILFTGVQPGRILVANTSRVTCLKPLDLTATFLKSNNIGIASSRVVRALSFVHICLNIHDLESSSSLPNSCIFGLHCHKDNFVSVCVSRISSLRPGPS